MAVDDGVKILKVLCIVVFRVYRTGIAVRSVDGIIQIMGIIGRMLYNRVRNFRSGNIKPRVNVWILCLKRIEIDRNHRAGRRTFGSGRRRNGSLLDRLTDLLLHFGIDLFIILFRREVVGSVSRADRRHGDTDPEDETFLAFHYAEAFL